ncbi:MAG: hypothetical protein CM15mV26_0980 [uncultured marine virus]|nr:MAG: hypothetical protein CM15mV26_0980 [uncultured marine virus]
MKRTCYQLPKNCMLLVSIKNEIYHLPSVALTSKRSQYQSTAISCGSHSVEHEILEVLECVSHLCFVHDGIFAQIGEDYKRPCDTLPTGQAADQFVLLSSEICVAVDVTFNVELFLFVNIVDFARSIIHQLQQESIILQSISAGVGVSLHWVVF